MTRINPWDKIMPVLREPLTWIPLCVYAVLFLPPGQGKAWPFIILTLLTVAITDTVTAQLLKPLFGRLRPCHDPELQPFLRGSWIAEACIPCLPIMPPTISGWPPSGTFSIREMNGRKWNWLWVWAAAICYAQIYVGKHYPFDILVGAVFGFLTGLGTFRLFVYWEAASVTAPFYSARRPRKLIFAA
jgi:undecaprenyl-diphosphatase